MNTFVTNHINRVLGIEDIDKIHNRFYNEKIMNKNGNKNMKESDIKVGDFYFRVHPNDTCISDCLKTGILFEKFILSYVRQYIDPTKNILDIGANIGVHSIVYSNYLTTGNVYSFEPQKEVYNLLCQNIEINNCFNVIPYNFGASNEDNIFFMNANYEEKLNQGAFRICNQLEHSTGIYIECKKIDDLILSNIGYIKIDVEGHELEALYGMTNTILNEHPTILIEIHESSPTKNDVFKFFENHSYTKYIRISHCDYLFLNN